MKRSTAPRAQRMLICFIGALLLPAGCGGKPGTPQLKIKSGNHQTGLPGQAVKKPLRVRLEQHVPGLLGGKGTSRGVAGEAVVFQVVGGQERGSFSTANGGARARVEVVTDEEGVAAVELTLGRVVGDVFVEARHEVYGKVEIRVAAGIVIEGKDQDGGVGDKLDEPIRVRLIDEAGNPRAGVPVGFFLQRGNKAKLSTEKSLTDADGWAQVELTLGRKTEENRLDVIPYGGVTYQPLPVKAFAVDLLSIIFVVVGGLAVFIWGMQMMSGGLQRVAGERLRSILQALVRNRFWGLAVGASVTAIVQSSSATTVMVVGFVNAGLMRLEQAIAMVLGANIGTTVTAQIIAFKITKLAGPAVAAGVLIYFLTRRRKLRFWAQALIGFGLLFLGLGMMSGSLKVLAGNPMIKGWFEAFSCAPVEGAFAMHFGKALLAVLLGTLVTIMVQSSSASIGLLLSLASAGLIDFYTAVPILLGDNIGTTITMELAALGANRTSKQAAHANAIFNVVGALWMILLFYVPWNGRPLFMELINFVTPGDAWADQNLERHIANTHTMFNVINVAIHLPLLPLLAWVCRRLTRGGIEVEEEEPVYLEPHLLDTPPLAMERVRAELLYMLRLAKKSNEGAFQGIMADGLKSEAVEAIRQREEKIDQRQFAIADYLQRLVLRTLTEEESRAVPPLLHAVNDIERVGDHAENLLELEERIREDRIKVPAEAKAELEQMHGAALRMFDLILQALEKHDKDAATQALEIEEQINDFYFNLNQSNTARLERGEGSLQAGLIVADVLTIHERIGDHLTNVAQALLGHKSRYKRSGD